MLKLTQGKKIVNFARKAIKNSFRGDFTGSLQDFPEKLGVFVTLLEYPKHELRGCIGFPYPELPLGRAVPEAAKAAAFADPRFPALSKEELDKIIIEVSVLTKPEELKCKKEDLSRNIKIGEDGLIVYFGDYSGLLLPQVPVEWGWNSSEFIRQTCTKAGIPQESWKNPGCRFYKFQAQIFAEEKPDGKVIAKKIR